MRTLIIVPPIILAVAVAFAWHHRQAAHASKDEGFILKPGDSVTISIPTTPGAYTFKTKGPITSGSVSDQGSWQSFNSTNVVDSDKDKSGVTFQAGDSFTEPSAPDVKITPTKHGFKTSHVVATRYTNKDFGGVNIGFLFPGREFAADSMPVMDFFESHGGFIMEGGGSYGAEDFVTWKDVDTKEKANAKILEILPALETLMDAQKEETGRTIQAEPTVAPTATPEPSSTPAPTATPPKNKPVITSYPTENAEVGKPFTYIITASDNPTKLEVIGLMPPGLFGMSIPGNADFPVYGEINGTPEKEGDYLITISATNSAGQGYGLFTLHVLPAEKATPTPTPSPSQSATPTPAQTP